MQHEVTRQDRLNLVGLGSAVHSITGGCAPHDGADARTYDGKADMSKLPVRGLAGPLRPRNKERG